MYLTRGSALASMVSHSLFNSGELLRRFCDRRVDLLLQDHDVGRRRRSDTQSAISSRAARGDQPLADDRRRLLERHRPCVELRSATARRRAAISVSVGVLADAKRCAR